MSASIAIDNQFNRFISISVAIHIALVGVLYFKNKIFINSDQVLIKNAIQVDIVALPDKARPKAPPKVAQKKPTVNLKKKKPKKNVKKNQSKAMQRLNALNAIDKLKKKQKEDEEKKQLEELKEKLAQKEPEQKKGNVITDADGLSGLDRIKMREFFSQVQSKMHENFLVPAFLKDKGFNTKVLLKADSSGNIIFKEISESSGNDIFDQAVLTSIDNASPVPAPPKVLQRRIEYEGFILGFPQ